jgi:hypothetical protein
VLNRPFASRYCPVCRGPVKKLSPGMDGADVAVSFVADWPFWILFGLCSAIGMWQWAAGLVAVLGLLAVAFAYVRSRARYKCEKCDRSYGYSFLATEQKRPQNDA